MVTYVKWQQPLGLKEKYQRRETPNFAQCYHLIIEHSSSPLIDAEQLVKWQIFNLIVGNSDAHIKNISFIYHEHETRLAPFYDLVCTRAIEHLDDTLALSIGNQNNPNQITEKNFSEWAEQCHIRPKRIIHMVHQMLSELEEKRAIVRSTLEEKHGEQPALQRVDRIIKQQTKRLRKNLSSL